jgi:O-antigen ligase
MSIRIALLTLLIIGLAVYAWRDWFKALCGLIVLMAVMEHPDMPKNIMGVQGLNPWNILMLDILLAWLVARRREGRIWDMPRSVNVLLLLYLAVVLVGFVRMMVDRAYMEEITIGYLIGEYLINTVKWVIPGLLLFDGCRTHARLAMAFSCILVLYLLLAVQVIRWMPATSALSGASLTARSRKIISNEIGYHAINISMLLGGACWATIAVLPLVERGWHKAGVIVGALAIAYAQALTGGRAGYATWGVVGLILCLVRWRKYLPLAPLVPVLIVIALPGVAERMTRGFSAVTATGDTTVDEYEVTSGRTLIWPYVIEKIEGSPIVGYGRLAMIRTGLRDQLWNELQEAFPHPHNAYLELLLDNGALGFLLIMPFYGVVIYQSGRLFLDRASAWNSAVGGVTLALVLALLVASFGSQTFYPREGAVGMWCAIGLMMRLAVERQRAFARPHAAFVRYPAYARTLQSA